MLEKQEKARLKYFSDMTKKQDKFLDLNVESRQQEFAEKARMERVNLEYQLKKEREDKEKEVTYIAYGENLEASVKLISVSKAINLVDNEKDVRTKRMFVSS